MVSRFLETFNELGISSSSVGSLVKDVVGNVDGFGS